MKRLINVCLLIIVIYATGCSDESKTGTISDNNSFPMLGTLEVYIFDIGKADAILIMSKNHTILIDAGENKHGQTIVDYLSDRGISTIDCFIITHFDKDHVGGADIVIENINVKEIFVANYAKDSKQYNQFIEASDSMGIKRNVLTEKTEFIFDEVKFTMYPSSLEYYDYGNSSDDADDNEEADDDSVENENNYSIALKVTYGNNNFLFTGDAKAKRLKELLSLDEITNVQYDILKVPHHGSYNKRTEDFIETINPKYAVITCSVAEPADTRTIEALEKVGTIIYLTQNGNVHFISDGNNLTVQVDNN